MLVALPTRISTAKQDLPSGFLSVEKTWGGTGSIQLKEPTRQPSYWQVFLKTTNCVIRKGDSLTEAKLLRWGGLESEKACLKSDF